MFTQVTIIGDGAMGCVCGMLLCRNGVSATLWGYNADQLAEFARAGENTRFLPGYPLPAELKFDADDGRAMAQARLLVSAVPCQFVRNIWSRLKPHVPPALPIVSVTKGIENGTLLRPTEVLQEVLGADHPCAALSGPTIADELMRGMPATATAACRETDLA